MAIVFYHEKIKFISSSRRVIFFLLYRQEYFRITTVLKREVKSTISSLVRVYMENTPLESRM